MLYFVLVHIIIIRLRAQNAKKGKKKKVGWWDFLNPPFLL